MGIRRTVAVRLEGAVGPDRLHRLKEAEARARRKVIDVLDVEAAQAGGPAVPTASGTRKNRPARPGAADPARAARSAKTRRGEKLTRQERIDALGRLSLEGEVNQGTNRGWVTPDPYVEHPEATASRHQVLAGLHRVLRPRTYLEIGVRKGASLKLSRTRTIGVDPAYAITAPLHCDLQTFRDKSDDFFRRPDALAHFDGVPVDLAFIDGMHLAEFALRDFINIEKQMSTAGVVVLDDVLPRNDLEAYRIRRTGAWSGDVYKILDVLGEHRRDLTVIPLNTTPTGTVLVAGLDPSSRVLEDAYTSIEDSLVVPDPQHVDDRWKRRTTARDPRALLDLDVWDDVVAMREKGATREELAPVWRRLRDLPPVAPATPTRTT